jgi:predicted transcriptional regulator
LKEGKNLNEIKRTLDWKKQKIEKALSWLMRENRVEEENEEYTWKG